MDEDEILDQLPRSLSMEMKYQFLERSVMSLIKHLADRAIQNIDAKLNAERQRTQSAVEGGTATNGTSARGTTGGTAKSQSRKRAKSKTDDQRREEYREIKEKPEKVIPAGLLRKLSNECQPLSYIREVCHL